MAEKPVKQLVLELKVFSGKPNQVEKEYDEWQEFYRKVDKKITITDKIQSSLGGGLMVLSLFFTEERAD